MFKLFNRNNNNHKENRIADYIYQANDEGENVTREDAEKAIDEFDAFMKKWDEKFPIR